MAASAASKFWSGVRAPWQLLGRMRQEPQLWGRYWRTVLLQAALTLVAGAAVFWVGKQGADAWNDAFGPDEPVPASAPAASVAPAPGPEAPPSSPPAGTATEVPRTAPADSAPRRPARGPKAPPVPIPPAPPALPRKGVDAAPPPPARSTVPEATKDLRPGAPASPTGDVGRPAGTEQADDVEDDTDDAPADAELEAQIEALKNAPAGEQARRTAELVAAAIARANSKAARTQRAGQQRGKRDPAEELASARDDLKDTIEEIALEADALAAAPPTKVGTTRKQRRHLEHRLDQVEKEAAKLQRQGAAPISAAERARLDHARTALTTVRRHEKGLAGRFGAVLALLAALYASLGIAQVGVLALSRDFHDALSRDLSLLIHVAPEDPPFRPKIRLDLPWVRRKANRRAQFFLGFLPGQALISVVGWLVPPHRTLATVLTALWAAYWWTVMTAGQSARAWSPPETTPRPWYLRAWFALTDRVFLFRWALPRVWGRLWERMSRRFYGPSERVEEQPLEFAGLALSRSLMLVPVVKLLLRPLFPVCAAHLLVEHAATARLPVPVTAVEVADAAARAPDPEARAHSGGAVR